MDQAARQRYRLEPYLDAQMPLALQASDLVVCRAGAATLSELAVLAKPGILVPLPPAIGGSPQEANAAMFGRKQAAQVIRNDDLQPQVLVERVVSIMSSNTLKETMANAALALARPQAAQEIAAAVIQIAKAR
jgi:UDP-N-acetylglucosamine--N-acetylmuramyl-(pentapeptide) pyrophosphoryl-undecaprenol N-acetylglucosamine transferase